MVKKSRLVGDLVGMTHLLTTCSKINQVVPYLNENYAERIWLKLNPFSRIFG